MWNLSVGGGVDPLVQLTLITPGDRQSPSIQPAQNGATETESEGESRNRSGLLAGYDDPLGGLLAKPSLPSLEPFR